MLLNADCYCIQIAPLIDPDFFRSSTGLRWPRRVHDEGEALLLMRRSIWQEESGEHNWVSQINGIDIVISMALNRLNQGILIRSARMGLQVWT